MGIVWVSAAARKYKNAQEGAVCFWTRVRKLTFNLDKHRLESSCSRLISRFHVCVHKTISTLSIPISSLWWELERRRAEPPPPTTTTDTTPALSECIWVTTQRVGRGQAKPGLIIDSREAVEQGANGRQMDQQMVAFRLIPEDDRAEGQTQSMSK